MKSFLTKKHLFLSLLTFFAFAVFLSQTAQVFAANHTSGLTTKGPRLDSGNENEISATQVKTGSMSGTLELSNVSIYIGLVHTAPYNHMQVALYEDDENTPGELLAASDSVTLQANRWNTIPMDATSLQADTKYWLAFNVDGSKTQYAISDNGQPRSAWKNPVEFGSWLTVFGAPTHDIQNRQYSLYMTYTSNEIAYISDYYKQWSNGPSSDPAHFPIGVWMQDPSRIYNGVANGTNYQNIGINMGMGLWEDDWYYLRHQGAIDTNWMVFPDATRAAEIVTETTYAQNFTGYLVEDEPDMNVVNDQNAYSVETITNIANATRATDPTRPTYINFGKAMAMDHWVGYYYQETYEQDMTDYCEAADIVSTDYYGLTDPWANEDNLGVWVYGRAVDNTQKYCGPNKPVWGFVETGQPWNNSANQATPLGVEQAVQNMVVHGATGLVYFVHNFWEDTAEDGLLHDIVMTAKVQQINTWLTSFASVLNTFDQPGVTVSSTNDIPVTLMHKKYNGNSYVFAQADGDALHTESGSTSATFTISGVTNATATVLDEERTVEIVDGEFIDSFDPYEMHIYRFDN